MYHLKVWFRDIVRGDQDGFTSLPSKVTPFELYWEGTVNMCGRGVEINVFF